MPPWVKTSDGFDQNKRFRRFPANSPRVYVILCARWVTTLRLRILSISCFLTILTILRMGGEGRNVVESSDGEWLLGSC